MGREAAKILSPRARALQTVAPPRVREIPQPAAGPAQRAGAASRRRIASATISPASALPRTLQCVSLGT